MPLRKDYLRFERPGYPWKGSDLAKVNIQEMYLQEKMEAVTKEFSFLLQGVVDVISADSRKKQGNLPNREKGQKKSEILRKILKTKSFLPSLPA